MAESVLSIVNKVLRKLRESEVLSIEGSDYPELITDLLTEIKKEVEDAWDWESLNEVRLSSISAADTQVSLTDAPYGSKLKSIYLPFTDEYLILDPTKVSIGLEKLVPEIGIPKYYKFAGFDTDGDMLIDVFPVPDTFTILSVNGKFVQGDIAYTNPDTNKIFTPTIPLVLGTYAKAIDERGDDDGEAFNKADTKYKRSLADAISYENAAQGDIMDWEVQ